MHHPLITRFRSKASPDWAWLLVRLVVGAIFVYHGYPKLFGPSTEMVVNFFRNIGVPMPELMAPFVGVVEFVGGLMLILGLGTRFWGLALAIDMAVAMLTAHKGAPSWWKASEFELVLFAASVQHLLAGAGHWSLDAWLMERSKKEHDAAMPAPTQKM